MSAKTTIFDLDGEALLIMHYIPPWSEITEWVATQCQCPKAEILKETTDDGDFITINKTRRFKIETSGA